MPGIVYTTFYANTRVDMPFCCPTAAFITAERSQSFHRSAAIECLASMDLLQDSSTVNNNTVNCVNNTNLWCYEGVAWICQCCFSTQQAFSHQECKSGGEEYVRAWRVIKATNKRNIRNMQYEDKVKRSVVLKYFCLLFVNFCFIVRNSDYL